MSVPETMTAVIAEPAGGPEVLKAVSLATPQPGAGEILVRVAAAGINRPDLLQRQGMYPPPPGAPATLGLELAGEVVATGPGTVRYRVGDAVTALVAGGGYAEYAVVPEPQALPVPAGLTMVQAAAIPETYFTVWTNVFERGRLRAGERFLVHGGASGIGTTAIQLAAALGAEVIATAGSAEKCAACVKLGAAHAFDYRTQDFAREVRAVWPDGVDVVLDMVGGPTVQKNISLLRPEGRLVFIAFLEGSKIEVDLLPLMLKRATLTGSTLRARPVADKGAIAKGLEEQVWPLLAGKALAPVIDSTFPLAQAAAAHAKLESRGPIGKIVLVTDFGAQRLDGR
ncbi:NAD(P)H-quinone oxidoreductase [Zavarzinia sp. CC-PAN008]|uniref:NAD(P)H-quinone oxidoreductase n=1 Tax=Zavarzinia sp. CC-PAN008 TaxID=3243332 RepID=UPI003F744E97